MKNIAALSSMIARVISDESGAETIEYALVLGLIVVGAIVVVSGVGTKTLGRWRAINSSL